MNLLDIQVDQLEFEPRRIRQDLSPESLDLLRISGFRFKNPVRAELWLQNLGSEIVARGQVEVDVLAACARCLEFYSTTLSDSSFVRSFATDEVAEILNLGEDIRESLLLELPSFPLCSPACKGLCPLCKNNLNNSACGCEPQPADDRWSGLQSLDLSDSAGGES